MKRVALLVALGSGCICAADPPAAMEHARSSYALAQSGNLDGAAAEMRAAIAAAPEDPRYLMALGGILARTGDLKEAKKCFAAAVSLDPRNAIYRYQLATKQWETGELEAARENLVQIESPGPPNAQAALESVSLELGALRARQRRWRAGLAIAQDTAKRFPDSARAWQMLGLFETRNNQNLAAVEAYTRALQLDPESADCSVGLGVAQSMAGMTAEAEKTFKNGLAKWPNDAVHHQAYGVLLLRLGEVDGTSTARGLELLQKALALDPQSAEAHYQLGNYALEQGDTAQAIQHLESAARGAAPSKVHYALSRAYRRAGKEQQAAEQLAIFQSRKQQEQEAPAP